MALIAELGAAIAAADPALVPLLRETLAALVEDHGIIAATQRRRARDRDRKRWHPSIESEESAESTESLDGTEARGIHAPPSPQVPLLPPTPPNNPSFPPPPLLPQPPQGHEEQRLYDRAPAAWPVVVQFLEGKDPTARAAWIGRFHGALDRPPHPTGQELADALGDLMTTPREQWVPTLFRRYVERIRRDANRDAEQASTARASARTPEEGAAGRAFAAIRALVTPRNVSGQGTSYFIPRAKVAELGERALAAYDNIGGADRFLDEGEQVGFVLRDFERAYRAANPTPAGATR